MRVCPRSLDFVPMGTCPHRGFVGAGRMTEKVCHGNSRDSPLLFIDGELIEVGAGAGDPEVFAVPGYACGFVDR